VGPRAGQKTRADAAAGSDLTRRAAGGARRAECGGRRAENKEGLAIEDSPPLVLNSEI
jgi:hypothetical protein